METTVQRQLPLKQLPLKGLLNTRELGFYPVTINGKNGPIQSRIKQGLIYRSGSPENMVPADKKNLEDRNIKTIVDFRSAEEKTSAFDLSSIKKRIELPIDAGNLMGAVLGTGEWLYNPNPKKAEEEMLRLYAALPEEAIPKYKELFSLLSDSVNTPLLMHCSAGKDRTGLASALILYALGADMETIMEDYLLSTENLSPYWERYVDSKPYLLPYYTVNEKYLETAFTAIEKYGGLNKYLTHQLGVDAEHLRGLYVE